MTRYRLRDGRIFAFGNPLSAATFETEDEARGAAAQVGLKPGHYILKVIYRDFLNRPVIWEIETVDAATQRVRQAKSTP